MKSRVKSKEERKADEEAAREAALSTAVDSSNKGFKMMAKLGYKPGEALGKTENARIDPITVSMKEDRGGVGLDTEKKRKIREELQHETKRVKAEETDYRERMRAEREEKRMEGQLVGAQKVLEKFDDAAEADDRDISPDDAHATGEDGFKPNELPRRAARKPLKAINVLWRGLLRHQLEIDRERRMRHDLQQSLTRNATYDDPDEDEYDKQALGKENAVIDPFDDLDEEDPELDEFSALPVGERLQKVVLALRSKFKYCFWCKYQYPDASMDGCPGLTEEDHD